MPTFTITLTGAADSTTDVILPCSNINARIRSGSESYLQCTIPYTSDYAEYVNDRTNGDIYLYYVDESVSTEVVNVALESIQISRGTSSSSIVLVGHRQSTNSSPGSHTVIPSATQSGSTSSTITVPGYNPDILPSDDITGEGVTLTIGMVTIMASVASNSFTVQTIYSEN